MISSVHPIVAPAWPHGWEDVEVVDSVLVDESAARAGAGRADAGRGAAAITDAGLYDRSGRVPAFRRFGRVIDVLA